MTTTYKTGRNYGADQILEIEAVPGGYNFIDAARGIKGFVDDIDGIFAQAKGGILTDGEFKGDLAIVVTDKDVGKYVLDAYDRGNYK